jgi:hypothetical protein
MENEEAFQPGQKHHHRVNANKNATADRKQFHLRTEGP